MAWQSVLGTILSSLYLVLYPLVYALWGILQLLQLLATPFMNLGLKILDVSLWPFRFMARFEALFIFLAMAILIGAISGLVIYITCTFTVDYLPGLVLGSSRPSSRQSQSREKMPQPKTEPKNRSLSEIPFHKYSTLPSDYSTRWGDRKDAGPLSSMILEEEESDRESEGDAFGYGFKEEKKEDLS